jgi:hypothetical protein
VPLTGPAQIVTEPADRAWVETDNAVLAVVAIGAPPLSYQWHYQNAAMPGETRHSIRLPGVASSQAGEYFAVVSNSSATVTSRVATLTVKANDPPVAGADGFVTALNTPLLIPFARLLANDSDPDGNPIRVTAADPVASDGGSVVMTNQSLLYTPPSMAFPDDVGAFSYTIADRFGGTAMGTVEVLNAEGPVPDFGRVLLAPTASGYLLRFVGRAGTSYRIERAPTVTGMWTTLTTLSDPHGFIEYEDMAPLPGMAFYRVATP